MLSGIIKLVKSINQDKSILSRSNSLSLSQLPPSYIYKNSDTINRLTRTSSLRKSIRRECNVNRLKTVIPAMMYAKIIIFIKNKAYICTIDGNCNRNTVPSNMFYNLDNGILSTCNILFNLEHSVFTFEFEIGNKIVLGRQFVEKYIEILDYQRGTITLKNNVKLDIYNEIPPNVITIYINGEYFLARIDATQEHSVISLEMLDKLQCDTTQTHINVQCIIQTEYSIPFEFDNLFYVVDNYNKYVILGLDFMTTYCTRVGKHYVQIKNKLRVFYLTI